MSTTKTKHKNAISGVVTKPKKGNMPPIEIAPPIMKPATNRASRYTLFVFKPKLEATSRPRAKISYLGDLIIPTIKAGITVIVPIQTWFQLFDDKSPIKNKREFVVFSKKNPSP